MRPVIKGPRGQIYGYILDENNFFHVFYFYEKVFANFLAWYPTSFFAWTWVSCSPSLWLTVPVHLNLLHAILITCLFIVPKIHE